MLEQLSSPFFATKPSKKVTKVVIISSSSQTQRRK